MHLNLGRILYRHFKPVILTLIFMLPWGQAQLLFAAEIGCDQPYTVTSGDTLSSIAAKAYDNGRKYNVIYYANNQVLTKGPAQIRVGQVLRIPCEDTETPDTTTTAVSQATEQTPPQSETQTKENEEFPVVPIGQREVELLTAGDYPPFTDKNSPKGGLITELLGAALTQNDTPYTQSWIDDWSSHLFPLLAEKKYDVGFPWFDPGCPKSDSTRCEFLFSKPVFELLIALFTRVDQPLKFDKDEDIIGSTLCRPAGYFTHDLDNNGRNWLADKKITLEQPKTVKECFDLLMAGEVDAVAINDFTGREQISKQGLTDKVTPLERELSIQGMHALVHKTHPRATILINRIDRGLAKLHASGNYDAIMDRHLINHWKSIEEAQ